MPDFLAELKRLNEAAARNVWRPDRENADLLSASIDDFEQLSFDRCALREFLANHAARIAALVEASNAFMLAWQDGHSELATPLGNYLVARNALDETEAQP